MNHVLAIVQLKRRKKSSWETLSDQSHHGYEGLDTDLRYDMFMFVQYIIQGPDRTSIDFSLTQMPPRYFPAKFQEFFD